MLEMWKFRVVVAAAADSMCACAPKKFCKVCCILIFIMKKLVFSGYESCTVSNQ